MEAIILAGGAGTRLQSLVSEVPKPMAPVRGRPFLEWLMDYWIGEGVQKFVLAVGYKHEIIQKHFGDAYKKARIKYSIEKEPLGTGGGLLLAMQTLETQDSFLVLNGDTYFEVPFKQFYREHENHQADISIALLRVPSDERYGTVTCDPHHVIKSFIEKGESSGAGLVNGGVYLVERAAFHTFPPWPMANISFERDILPLFLGKESSLYGFDFSNKFVDIGIPEDYENATRIL